MTADGFFDHHQRATVEAAMARIIPTDDLPGAREAGTIDFLDRYLAGLGSIYAKPDGSGFENLVGKQAEAWQRRLDIIRLRYVAGIAELDGRSRTAFGAEFIRLTTSQQDTILAEMEPRDTRSARDGDGDAAPLQQTKAEIDLDFFPLLCVHTRQGFYADPIYGGNREHIGWEVIGFPGPASMAEVYSGRYSTLAWFAEQQPAHEEEVERDA